jgi:glycosyltransferase involved in cell wall biosynthesis
VDASYAGGAERYVSMLAGGLDRSVFEPMILARRGTGLDRWCEELSDHGVTVVRVPMDMPFRPHHAVPVYRSLQSLLPHILHINVPGPYDGQMGLLAPLARMAGCPRVIVTEHLPRVERLWKRAVVKRIAYNWVDGVLTVCRSNVRYLIERQRVAADKIDVVYNGIPSAYGSRRNERRTDLRDLLGLQEDTVGIVYVGSLIERKGIGMLLEALSRIEKNRVRLFVIGTGDDRAAYEDTARRLGLHDRVSFRGDVTAGEVEDTLCAADLLVAPSFMEGMPYVILEAMACSLPVVASRVDGIPEAAPDGEVGMLVPVGDTETLREAIERVIGDAHLRHILGQKGRKRFKELFTLERHIARMQLHYLKVLQGRR